MAPEMSELDDIYTLKISLRGSKPPIWRRVRIAGDFTLLDLHYVIQSAMGWQNCHLFQFEKEGRCYSDLSELNAAWELSVDSASEVKVGELLLHEQEKVTYLYDFGDCWEHEIVVEKIERGAASQLHPECLTGKRACPIEDCGGIVGYQRMVTIAADADDARRQAVIDWVGEELDAEHFDLGAVNVLLAGIART